MKTTRLIRKALPWLATFGALAICAWLLPHVPAFAERHLPSRYHRFVPTGFAQPWCLLLVLLSWPVWHLGNRLQPTIRYFARRLHEELPRSSWIGNLPDVCLVAVFLSLVAIVALPQRPEVKTRETKETIAIMLIVDGSQSMDDEIKDAHLSTFAQEEAKRAKSPNVRKIDAAKAGIRVFVNARSNDLLSLAQFGEDFYIVCVSTDEPGLVLSELENIGRVLKEGTNFEGPTASMRKVGCFQGAINYAKEIKKLFAENGMAFPDIFVAGILTDGESSISEIRAKELRDQIAALGMYVDVLGVGDSWTKTPPEDSTKDIRALLAAINADASAAAGKAVERARVFPIQNAQDMDQAFRALDKLHRTPVTIERDQGNRDEYTVFAGSACVSLALFLLTALAIGRRV